ncbi:MAG: hypothetical protein WDO19_08285 [Bacteroidota bacterium]
MLLRTPILLLIFFITLFADAQDKIVQRIFLVGDAGELDNGKHPVCDWLKQNVNWDNPGNTIVYLGDNIYPLGMPAEGSKSFETSKAILDYQVSVVKNKNAKAFLYPAIMTGNGESPAACSRCRMRSNILNHCNCPMCSNCHQTVAPDR